MRIVLATIGVCLMIAVLIATGLAVRAGDYVLAAIGIVVWGGYSVVIAAITKRSMRERSQ